MGISVVNDVEPVASSAYSVSRRRQQTIDQSLIGCRIRVCDKFIDGIWFGGKSVQIETKATDQSAPVRFSRW